MCNAMKVVKDAYTAFGRGEVHALLALIAATIDWRVVGPASLPYATTCRTRAEVQRYFDDLFSAEEITKFELREFIDGVASFDLAMTLDERGHTEASKFLLSKRKVR
ncbi:nuclear transport factor 2 family protein [Paraburkholderia sp. BL9I2N2]|uniref:nuclear transport factor 2 family protein n=1 Tax=Paraburkholderia sp. BL9I2N2 TaxID=1938809 RepID=UPI0010F1E9B4|nr:nuclear transport factor 2 family protein [Paraburkholderia sp. BL9I2N2]TCK96973.1 hypothetical protein B0G74_3673 [Paraburkholderia sp. BL9I2N2]